ncbi:LANO_0E02564g1_1 [Lachancea nothofagi CBS 11611]|uniref:LANO_0E02564g1_1 n=1 Tax=Lachancea nothofagi CBS 11611 TaxID=1266666 RepID=A0A1G4JQD6_9SACH|nr:LANO_0E02564g1_1 [Lachancea nothofagi CBS 11611]
MRPRFKEFTFAQSVSNTAGRQMLTRLRSLARAASKFRFYSSPPTYFGTAGLPTQIHRPVPHLVPTPKLPVRKPLLELATVFSVLALSFFAIDNYRARLRLELKVEEDALKFKQAQDLLAKQANAHRKKRELQILNERKLIQTREMKVALHVAMLRKQLIEAGLKPATIEQALHEFEKHVKMENSISNVSGTRLWVTDDSPSKCYVSDVREYDNRE